MSAVARPPRPQPQRVVGENIPQEITHLDRWVAWRYTWNGKKWDKPPSTIAGSAASSTDPTTWTTFQRTYATYCSRSSGFDGIGLVLVSDDDLAGIDLDHCRDPQTGTVEDWALSIVAAFDSYTEISPSGSGLRILVRGTLPDGGRKRGNIEMYQDGRYLTITGQRLPGSGQTIARRQEALTRIHTETFGAKREEPRRAPRSPGSQDAAMVMGRMFESKKADLYRRLYSGDWSGYSSQSNADAALMEGALYWSGGDGSIAAQIMRDSGLYRDRWETRRGAGRLLEYSVNRILDRMNRFYEEPPVLIKTPRPAETSTVAGESECQAEVQALRAQLAERDATIAQLRQERAAIMHILAVPNENWNAAGKICGITTLLQIAREQQRRGLSADTPVEISRGSIKAASGLSTGMISDYWGKLNDTGVISKTNGYRRPRRVDEITGAITEFDGPPVEVAFMALPAPTPAAALERMVQRHPTPITRGGNRPKRVQVLPTCPEHPDAPIEMHCSACQRLLQPVAAAPESQVGTDQYDNHAECEAVTPACQLGSQAESEPHPIRPLLKCFTCHTWLNLDGSRPRECAMPRLIREPTSPPEDNPGWWADMVEVG